MKLRVKTNNDFQVIVGMRPEDFIKVTWFNLEGEDYAFFEAEFLEPAKDETRPSTSL